VTVPALVEEPIAAIGVSERRPVRVDADDAQLPIEDLDHVIVGQVGQRIGLDRVHILASQGGRHRALAKA